MTKSIIKSDITGTVWKVEVREGDKVEEDHVLMVLESMKMEIPVMATDAGTVLSVLVKEGESVREGQDLAIVGNN